jgi:subtilisin family serine protease
MRVSHGRRRLALIALCALLGSSVAAGGGDRAFARAGAARSYYCPAGTVDTGTADPAANGTYCAYQLAASFPLGGTSAPSQNATMVPSLDVLPVWQRTQGAGVTVAVLDSGVDPSQPDLQPNLLPGWNTYAANSDTADQAGHGTILASIIGAAADNGGYVGIAPQARLLPVKIVGPGGNWSARAAVKGIYYAIDHGAGVINCSFGGLNVSMPGMRAALAAAAKANVVVVLAAGNHGVALGGRNVFYPDGAGLANTLTVANFDSEGQLAADSDYGPAQVQVAAPGDFLYGDIPGGDAGGTVGGTSAATATVSGVVALLRSAFPRTSAAQIIAAVLAGITPVPDLQGKVASGGLVSASGALAALAGHSG